MEQHLQDLIRTAYDGFNRRDIVAALATMHPEVEWPKAFEGGYVSGREAVGDYWARQWTEIDPMVEPVAFHHREDGSLEVTVHQVVKDMQGSVLFDGMVLHVYTVQDGLLRRMDIEST